MKKNMETEKCKHKYFRSRFLQVSMVSSCFDSVALENLEIQRK
jgi:hypothetical protein